MRPKYFFECCRDLHTLGCQCRMDHQGGLMVVTPIDVILDEPTTFTHPLFVVSRMVTGYCPSCPKDIWMAAKRLELSREFAMMVFTAAIVDMAIDQDTVAVREELIHNLRPVKLFEPHLNSLDLSVVPIIGQWN